MIFASIDGRLAVDTQRCVLLDGCFDPIHFGHIKYVREAKHAFPDWPLVVTVASDDEIRSKGREPFLPQMTRCAVVDGLAGVDTVITKDRPTHEIISALKPGAYVKGADWLDRLPPEQLAACSLNDVQIVYLNTVIDASTARLRAWAAREDARHLAQLESLVQSQQPPSEPWQPVTDYSFGARKAIEGEHPRLIAEAFQGCSMLDVGCGPGHLVRLLRESGVAQVYGMDLFRSVVDTEWYTQGDVSDPMLREYLGWNSSDHAYDLVICREVLEHIPFRNIPQAVANLCQLAGRFVYVTTRFTKAPANLLKADTSDDLDPTHISMLNQDLLRTLFVLNGGKRRRDLETTLDHQGKGRVLVYELQ